MIKGCDISKFQDLNSTPQQIDFVKLKQKFDWISIRVTFGDQPDEDFAYNWREAKRAGFPRMAYIFYDYRRQAALQVAKAIELIGDDKPELFVAWDMEKLYLWNSTTQRSELVPMPSADNYLSSSLVALNTLKQAYGKVVSYLNPDMIKNYLGYTRSAKLAEISDLWIAHWGVSSPSFAPWPDWTFWQTGSFPVNSAEYGIESKELDFDYYNGTLADLRAWCGIAEPLPDPDPIDIDLTVIMERLDDAETDIVGLKLKDAELERRIKELEDTNQRLKDALQ